MNLFINDKKNSPYFENISISTTIQETFNQEFSFKSEFIHSEIWFKNIESQKSMHVMLIIASPVCNKLKIWKLHHITFCALIANSLNLYQSLLYWYFCSLRSSLQPQFAFSFFFLSHSLHLEKFNVAVFRKSASIL